jgi:predicted RNA-binding Zn-ribbon protein involved in translation (DUF1610 family)
MTSVVSSCVLIFQGRGSLSDKSMLHVFILLFFLLRYILIKFVIFTFRFYTDNFWFSVFTEFSTYEAPSSYSGSGKELFEAGIKTVWNTNFTSQLLAVAMTDTQGLSHYCPNCGKAYSWKSNLTRHLRLECGKAPRQQCPYCPYITNHKCVVQKHIRRHHKDMPNIP